MCLVGWAHNDAVAGLDVRCMECAERQKKSAGRRNVDVRDFVVGSELDAMDDAALVIEIHEVVGREAGYGWNAFEWVKPEGGVGAGNETFDENLDGPQRIRARVDDGDTWSEEVRAGLVVDAVFPSRHGGINRSVEQCAVKTRQARQPCCRCDRVVRPMGAGDRTKDGTAWLLRRGIKPLLYCSG